MGSLVDCLVIWFFECLIDGLIHWFIKMLKEYLAIVFLIWFDWLIYCLINWIINFWIRLCLFDWLIEWLLGELIDWLILINWLRPPTLWYCRQSEACIHEISSLSDKPEYLVFSSKYNLLVAKVLKLKFIINSQFLFYLPKGGSLNIIVKRRLEGRLWNAHSFVFSNLIIVYIITLLIMGKIKLCLL